MNGASSSVQGLNDDELPYQTASASKRARMSFLGLCPLCGATRELSQTANYRAVAIAKNADPDTKPLFKNHEVNSANDTFRKCGPCYSVVSNATKVICASSSYTNDVLSSILNSKTARTPAKIIQVALTCQGQPLIEMFRSITRGQLTVSFDSPDEAAAAAPRENVYAVGDLVNLPRRKQANVNEDGGVAVVLSFRCAQVKGKHSVFYSVKHTVGGRVENDLSESLLEPYSYDTSKKRRSVDAEAKAKLVAEERELELLQRENARLRERVHNLEADATRTELQKVDLRAKYKETKRAASELAQKNEELNSKMSAQYQAMQKNVNDLLAEAKSQAQREAAEAKSQAMRPRCMGSKLII